MTGEKKKEIWRVVKFVLFSASAGIIQIGLFTRSMNCANGATGRAI